MAAASCVASGSGVAVPRVVNLTGGSSKPGNWRDSGVWDPMTRMSSVLITDGVSRFFRFYSG